MVVRARTRRSRTTPPRQALRRQGRLTLMTLLVAAERCGRRSRWMATRRFGQGDAIGSSSSMPTKTAILPGRGGVSLRRRLRRTEACSARSLHFAYGQISAFVKVRGGLRVFRRGTMACIGSRSARLVAIVVAIADARSLRTGSPTRTKLREMLSVEPAPARDNRLDASRRRGAPMRRSSKASAIAWSSHRQRWARALRTGWALSSKLREA